MDKLSVIIPVFNTAKFLKRCLNSVLTQSYQNIEIIVVDDGSRDNSARIIERYAQKDTRIKIVTHEKNRGLFQARVSGAAQSAGAYLAFLDSVDYVSIDYYRTLIYRIQKDNADMAIGGITEEFDDGRKIIYNLAQNESGFETLEGEEILKRYFRQEGLNYYWQVTWNKVYTRKLFEKSIPYLSRLDTHLVICEDIVFSTVFFFNAEKISRVQNDCYFYCRHGDSAVGIKNLSYNKQLKNIEDITTVFNFVEQLFKEGRIPAAYTANLDNWKASYKQVQKYNVLNTKCTFNQAAILRNKLDIFYKNNKEIANAGYFFSIQTKWNPQYETTKRTICESNAEYISFDIFDTLLTRPFWQPIDLFDLLNDEFRRCVHEKTFVDFSELRKSAETIARRNINNPQIEDITLDEIYDALSREYRISKTTAEYMKAKEIETELKFCSARKSAFELYELAAHLGKKIICVSDMYLPKTIIEKLLVKNGYTQIEKIYVSSETKVCKSGGMFPFVLADLPLAAGNMLHIGDNYESDYCSARKNNINAIYYPKAADVFFACNGLKRAFRFQLTEWQNDTPAFEFWGIRTMCALGANAYFDNPFRSFNHKTDFNADADLIGGLALGMQIFGIGRWLIKNFLQKPYDTVVFLARDGYLPMECYKILKPLYPNMPEARYFPISRQALLQIAISGKYDFYKAQQIVLLSKKPKEALHFFKRLFIVDEAKLEALCREKKINFDEAFTDLAQYHRFLNICAENFFDEQEHRVRRAKLKEYFDSFFKGSACAFDIGFSARPELYISALCEKPIDTYFMHASSEAYHNAKIGNFNLNTYLNDKPVFGVFMNEPFLSKNVPSCIGYDTSGETAVPVYSDDFYETYPTNYIIDKMQTSALELVKTLVSLFGEHIRFFDHAEHCNNILLRHFIYEPKKLDQLVLNGCLFEDSILKGCTDSVITIWNEHLASGKMARFYTTVMSKIFFTKLLYFCLFNRGDLKKKIKMKLSSHKTILNFMRINYKVLRRVLRIITRK
ncbi:MAG: glycosyltransferase [Spirochaetaceae bacterium]|jgi:glycosyltransferase involved in cell wall biosynthesis/FMN phosphatase YigB (HAD superfamily)|nr:glycosyltransferase [Spirochaetaceae bacterium]